MAKRLMHPLIDSKAALKNRLTDFETGKAALQPEHVGWLNTVAVRFLNDEKNANFKISLFGFASKLGGFEANNRLSFDRASAVIRHIEAQVPRATTQTPRFQALGESVSTGNERDDSPVWRAVEIHVFRDNRDPDPVPPVVPRGDRNWSVKFQSKLKTFGAGKLSVAQAGAVLVTFRNDTTHALSRFLVPASGAGANTLTEAFARRLVANEAADAGPAGADGFAKVNTLIPFRPEMIDGDTAGFVGGKFIVYGKHFVTDKNGRHFPTVTVCVANAAGVKTAMSGGPLIRLN